MYIKISVSYNSDKWYPGKYGRILDSSNFFFIDEDELAKVKKPDPMLYPIEYKRDIMAFNAETLRGYMLFGCWRSSNGGLMDELVADRAVAGYNYIERPDVMSEVRGFPELGVRELDI